MVGPNFTPEIRAANTTNNNKWSKKKSTVSKVVGKHASGIDDYSSGFAMERNISIFNNYEDEAK